MGIDGLVAILKRVPVAADCFKFRNQLGMDVVLKALKLYKARRSFDVGELIKYAKVCRVENVTRPYIEAML